MHPDAMSSSAQYLHARHRYYGTSRYYFCLNCGTNKRCMKREGWNECTCLAVCSDVERNVVSRNTALREG